MDSLIEEITKRLFVELEASGRHVHLTKEAAQALFGHSLTPLRELSQPGQFVARERLSLITEKGRMDKVAVLGPERKACQVELSQTDCVTLGVKAPLRDSGDVKGSPGLTLANGDRTLKLSEGVIVAKRHIHMTPEDASARKLQDKQRVKLRTLSSRPLVFEDVTVRVSPDFRTYAHLDFDEANACGYAKGDLGMIE
ncbi:MAG: phosphate propanoyltransferase [Oscillospiraceae bacterium]|nr:phosphate propanoyltransferase [Oscillospiraceae bacterium]